MPTNDSQKSRKKYYYLTIDGEKIPVTEKVYRAYRQPRWTERKRNERKKRCAISNGRGGLKRCSEDCSQCGRQRTGSVLSLDRFIEDGYEAADPTDFAELVADKLLFEELYAALEELDLEDQQLIKALYFDNRTSRNYGSQINKSHQTVNVRREKAVEKMRLLMGVKKIKIPFRV